VTATSTESSAVGGQAVLEAHDLRVEFGGVQAVNGVSFAVPAGRITGLIGPNGAGKSTVLQLMTGSLKPTGGRVLYRGRDVTGKPAYALARLGLIRTFQLSSEFAHLTVIENLLVAAPDQRATTFRGALLGKRYWRGQQAELVETARGLLDDFDMTSMTDEYAGELSGGQRRLVWSQARSSLYLVERLRNPPRVQAVNAKSLEDGQLVDRAGLVIRPDDSAPQVPDLLPNVPAEERGES